MASRKEQKAELRRQREERERAAAEAARRKRTMGYVAAGGLAAAAVIVLVGVLAFGGDGGGGAKGGGEGFPDGSVPARKIMELEPAAKAAGCTLKSYPDFLERAVARDPALERTGGHTSAPVNYETNPPTSGPHHDQYASDGAYANAPPKERLMHALEHGRVIFQFRPSAPASTRGDLKALFDEDPQRVILTPNTTGMPYEAAATSWRQLLGCPRMNERVFDAMRAFRDRYRDRGPEYVPQPE